MAMHPVERSGKERPSLSLHTLSSSSLHSIYAITPRSFFLSNADNHCMRLANLEMMAEHQAGLHNMLSGIRQDPTGFRRYVYSRRGGYIESPLSQASVTYSEASPSKVHAFFDGVSDHSGCTTPDENEDEDDGDEEEDDYDDNVDPAARQALLLTQAHLRNACMAAHSSLHHDGEDLDMTP